MTDEPLPFDGVDLPFDSSKTDLPDVYAAIEVVLRPTEEYEPNEEVTFGISTYELELWLQHACANIVHIGGQPPCDIDLFPTIDVGSPLATDGVHERGSCAEGDDPGCAIYEVFGSDPGRTGTLVSREHYSSTEIRPWTDAPASTSETATTFSDDHPQMITTVLWRFTLDDLPTLGLLAEGLSYLNTHASEYGARLGKGKLHATVTRAKLLNPLYTPLERLQALESDPFPSFVRIHKDKVWRETLREASVEALQERLSGPDGLEPAITAGADEGDADGDDDTHGSADDQPGGDQSNAETDRQTDHRQRGDWIMSYWG